MTGGVGPEKDPDSSSRDQGREVEKCAENEKRQDAMIVHHPSVPGLY